MCIGSGRGGPHEAHANMDFWRVLAHYGVLWVTLFLRVVCVVCVLFIAFICLRIICVGSFCFMFVFICFLFWGSYGSILDGFVFLCFYFLFFRIVGVGLFVSFCFKVFLFFMLSALDVFVSVGGLLLFRWLFVLSALFLFGFSFLGGCSYCLC